MPTISDVLVKRFLKEASIVAKLKHDNILKLLDYPESLLIIVYELADGNLLEIREHLKFKGHTSSSYSIMRGFKIYLLSWNSSR